MMALSKTFTAIELIFAEITVRSVNLMVHLREMSEDHYYSGFINWKLQPSVDHFKSIHPTFVERKNGFNLSWT